MSQKTEELKKLLLQAKELAKDLTEEEEKEMDEFIIKEIQN
jgi:hypothetical protein